MLAYRALLRLYPASWRAEYGDEMRADFAARRRDASGLLGWLGLWLDVLPDLVTNAAAIHWDVLRQDLRYAARTLRRTPGFAAAAVAIGAIGIGATTAAFTMADHVLVRPFPYRSPDRLVRFNMARTQGTWDVVSPGRLSRLEPDEHVFREHGCLPRHLGGRVGPR